MSVSVHAVGIWATKRGSRHRDDANGVLMVSSRHRHRQQDSGARELAYTNPLVELLCAWVVHYANPCKESIHPTCTTATLSRIMAAGAVAGPGLARLAGVNVP